MSQLDEYYVKMTTIPKVSQQGVALNAYELADTKAEGINPLPIFTEQKSIVPSDETMKIAQLTALAPSVDLTKPEAQEAMTKVKALSDNQRLVGFGFLAYLIYKFIK